MDHIRLIASDMDATLLDGHSQLPPDFLHLVQELADRISCSRLPAGGRCTSWKRCLLRCWSRPFWWPTTAALCAGAAKTCSSSRMEPEVWHRLTACAEENGDSFVVCGLENAYLRPL